MKIKQVFTVIIILVTYFSFGLYAQNKPADSGYEFKDLVRLPATTIKNQSRTGTCWSFATMSFLESELLRNGKGEYDLSEMFAVRNCYPCKADKYVRMHGKTNFDRGGLSHDVLWVLKNRGMMPEEAYSGLLPGKEYHDHREMDAKLLAFVDSVISNKVLSTGWKKDFEDILDNYLGTCPDEFKYRGKDYTPESFADELGIDPEDYVILGSYLHHPFFTDFILEVPDNWMWGKIINVPLGDMMHVIDNSIKNGYTVLWDADDTEKGFSRRLDIAMVPSSLPEDIDPSLKDRWNDLSGEEKEKIIYDFSKPVKEMTITKELRQASFDNYSTTDDHLMHIIGLAEDQDGKPFYIVKNSWGTEGRRNNGYLYASKAYVEYKSILIMVNRNAIPEELSERLDL